MSARTLVSGLMLFVASLATARDLRDYDKIGPLNASFPSEAKDVLDRMRAFVESHWKQHRRGYVTFTVHTLEGDPTTGHIYIEPAVDGSWVIRGDSHSIYSDRRMLGDPKKQPNRHVRRSFEAVSLHHDGRWLVLKDRSGKVVDSM